MDFELFFAGIAFFLIGLLMLRNARKTKPASEETNWEGPLRSEYIKLWGSAILAIIVGLVFILKSLIN